jgi:glutamate dehydrogenase/leucine dehydrogenase
MKSRPIGFKLQEWTTPEAVCRLRFLNKTGETFLCEVLDHAGVPHGWVFVDSQVSGKSHGGLRMTQMVTSDELRDLAHRMTLKFGFLGLAGGGAKAGVIGDPEAPKADRIKQLLLFADAIAPLIQTGVYMPHPDVGTSSEEIREMLQHLKIKRGPREPTREQSGSFTSMTVVTSAQIGLEHVGLTMETAKAAIEGFGKVGMATAQRLSERGVRIVAVSTSQGALYNPAGLNLQQLILLQQEFGSLFVKHYEDAESLPIEQLLTLPVDLLCPCGVGQSIHRRNASQVQARVISAGANCPVTPEAEELLHQSNVLFLPDFITNSGGVLGGTMAFAGISLSATAKLIEEKLGPRIRRLIETAKQEGKRMDVMAAEESMRRFHLAKKEAEKERFGNTLFQIGLEFFRRGWLPPALIRGRALDYFARRLE